MLEKHRERIVETPLFADIDSDNFDSMMKCLNPRINSYKKNDYITVSGNEFNSIGIILEGKAMISKVNPAGDRVVLNALNPGDIFGEIIVFSNKDKWPATIQAQNESMVFFLGKEKLLGNCENVCPWHKVLIENILGIISERALLLNKKIEYLSIKSIQGKVSTYLLEQYNKIGKKSFEISMNRKQLADFLNVSRPSMSRELGKMRDKGIIDFHLSEFVIKDVSALKKLTYK